MRGYSRNAGREKLEADQKRPVWQKTSTCRQSQKVPAPSQQRRKHNQKKISCVEFSWLKTWQPAETNCLFFLLNTRLHHVHDIVSHSVEHQIAYRVELQFPHDV
jgi:hypothetical protein